LTPENILNVPTSGRNIIKSAEVEKAMRAVLRENYVRSTERDSAYVDSPQPIGMRHLFTILIFTYFHNAFVIVECSDF
jgi:protein-L-isoaspartate O-methyltransferase